MANLLGRMQRAIIVPFLSDEPRRDEFYPQLSLVEGIDMREQKVNFLQEKITHYLLQVSKQELSDEQSPVDGLLVSAYTDPQKGNQVYVLTNLSEESMKLDFGQGQKANTYTTDKHRDMEFSEQSLSQVNIPARSVVTVLK